MDKQKKSGFIYSIITIILLIIIVIFSNNLNGKASFFQNIINNIISPVQEIFFNIQNKINKNESYLLSHKQLEEKVKQLEEENQKLNEQNRELEIIKNENNELKDYLNLTQKYAEFKTIPANVIDRDFSNFSKILVINVGSNDGIEKSMTVIADKGLVGRVIEVSKNSSKVLPITDASSSVSCIMSTSKQAFIAKGLLDYNDEVKGIYIPTQDNIFIGDNIETSGIGGIFPKGIHVGVIKKILNSQNIVDKSIVINPAVDFEKLTSVLVIKE